MSKPSGIHHAIVTECPEISGCTLYTSDSENTVLERELSCNGLDKFTYVAPNQYSSCHSQPLTWCSFSHVTHRYAPKASLLLAHAGVYLGMPIALHLGHVRALDKRAPRAGGAARASCAACEGARERPPDPAATTWGTSSLILDQMASRR